MAGGKQKETEGSSTTPSAIRIRDNQRRSRARHKEYVDTLQRKLQEYERRGVEATMEMQQAARNVAAENSRLRILLGYHGVTGDDIDKFLQTFPDQGATEASKATITQLTAPRQLPLVSPAVAPITLAHPPPLAPFQPLSRSPSAGPSRLEYGIPQMPNETSTREAVDAIVGIKRDSRKAGISQLMPPLDPRQPLLQPHPQPPQLPVLPALVVGSARRDHAAMDKLSVLASASVQQDGNSLRAQNRPDQLHVPSPPTSAHSPPTSTSGASSSRLPSVSPRSRELRLTSPLETMGTSTVQVVNDVHRNLEPQFARTALSSDDQDDRKGKARAAYQPLGSNKPR